MRFAFIDAEKESYPLTVLCRVMQVTRSGYYGWRNRKPSAREQRDATLLGSIRAFHEASRRRYGSPRIWDDLREAGEAVSQKRVERLMRQNGLFGKHRRRFKPATTDSQHDRPVAPNLLNRQFEAERPNVTWSSDITQLSTPEGWLYLAIVLDVFARTVVGWAMSERITRHLVLNAVNMAILNRRPDPGLIFHSDRGVQYAADDTATLLTRHGIQPSMSGVGCCYDNAVSESFFATLKVELGEVFPSRSQARSDVFQFIETYYNPYRRHSFNGNISPLDCEAFFAQHGRRPTGVKDLLAERAKVGIQSNAPVEGAPSHVSQPIQPVCTAVQAQCREVHILSI